MLNNTDLFYLCAKEFQDKRQEITEERDKSLKSFESYKGSSGYEEDVKRINNACEAKLEALRGEYRKQFNVAMHKMSEAIEKRTVNAPTTEQLNLLNMLKLKNNITLDECRRVAESVKDNPIAVGIVTEVAHEHGIMHSFNHLCNEMSTKQATAILHGMKKNVEDFMRYDTVRMHRVVERGYRRKYGDNFNIPLAKRPLFTDKTGCYSELSGIDNETLGKFSEIVDS